MWSRTASLCLDPCSYLQTKLSWKQWHLALISTHNKMKQKSSVFPTLFSLQETGKVHSVSAAMHVLVYRVTKVCSWLRSQWGREHQEERITEIIHANAAPCTWVSSEFSKRHHSSSSTTRHWSTAQQGGYMCLISKRQLWMAEISTNKSTYNLGQAYLIAMETIAVTPLIEYLGSKS